MWLRALLRMALWARNPPSESRVKFVLAVIAVCLALFALERFFGWPDWLTPEFTPNGRIRP
ncbi:hypothetical protein SAMN05216257_102493 [Meinhardsimonia xiamenensis]|uniref:Uncharacterized protein n=1 Tax=Meinhardsimonia xiamenensis TaxID=990712 RepID=A0A1G9BDI0_9RHOB|nr:hypothetical protein [Meinhardsimonia xiamenensis]PRX35032.1 hypothetical protein LV81_01626 [Meinhardsimonia xiamenensis]SDK37124.1 hypothetical protein SAMN05216257_102493 [Meinhardsimonia xiamenensis]